MKRMDPRIKCEDEKNMFTGVIHHLGTITEAQQQGDLTLTIAHDFGAPLTIGESIACNGACLTVISSSLIPHPTFTTQLSAETLTHTAPRWKVGDKLHLERAMRLGDALDGHLVTGHVDGLATLISVTQEGGSHRLTLEAPDSLARFIAAKGSVTLDGISLTVNEVEGNRFGVNLIPHTWQVTTFAQRKPGDTLNLEIDLIARYVARLTER